MFADDDVGSAGSDRGGERAVRCDNEAVKPVEVHELLEAGVALGGRLVLIAAAAARQLSQRSPASQKRAVVLRGAARFRSALISVASERFPFWFQVHANHRCKTFASTNN